jgi:hypothetical protein
MGIHSGLNVCLTLCTVACSSFHMHASMHDRDGKDVLLLCWSEAHPLASHYRPLERPLKHQSKVRLSKSAIGTGLRSAVNNGGKTCRGRGSGALLEYFIRWYVQPQDFLAPRNSVANVNDRLIPLF